MRKQMRGVKERGDRMIEEKEEVGGLVLGSRL